MTALPKYMEQISDLLMQHAAGLKDPGLLQGKMGLALYFFYLAKHTGNTAHQNFAETLLDEVYEYIQNNQSGFGFADGLAGIAWAIVDLVENRFVEADVDEVLSDADDKIYHHLHGSQEISFGFSEGLLGYLFYVATRIRWRKASNQAGEFVFERLLVDLLNRISVAVDERRWRASEPPFFNLNWDLPLLLLLLAKIKRLNFYEYKLDKVVNSVAPLVLSTVPYHHTNRLYLSYSIVQLLECFDLPDWKRHVGLLQAHIDRPRIFDKELGDKNIFLSNGLAGLSFILQGLGRHPSKGGTPRKINLAQKIQQSQYFQSIIKTDPAEIPNLTLLNGLTGIGFQFLFENFPIADTVAARQIVAAFANRE
jgi:hypothetical protein